MPHKPTGGKPGRPRKRVTIPDLGEKPELTLHQWKALAVEYRSVDWSLEPWTSSAPLRKVAADAEFHMRQCESGGLTRSIIKALSGWRMKT